MMMIVNDEQISYIAYGQQPIFSQTSWSTLLNSFYLEFFPPSNQPIYLTKSIIPHSKSTTTSDSDSDSESDSDSDSDTHRNDDNNNNNNNHKPSSPTPFCDQAMIVAKAWEVSGTGSFIGEPLAADMLRAIAYKHIGWEGWRRLQKDHHPDHPDHPDHPNHPDSKNKNHKKVEVLEGGIIRRKGKRKILNHIELVSKIQETWSANVSF